MVRMPDQERLTIDVRAILRSAIHNGVYGAGETMPSSRELAAKFGINRNTANKIYHELAAEGLIDLAPHRPPHVRAAPVEARPLGLDDQIRDALWHALLQCRLRGTPASQIRQAVTRALDEFLDDYAPPEVHVAECNWPDAERYSRELSDVVGFPVRPVLIEDLHEASGAEVIVTPTFHVAEVRERLGGGHDRVLGFLSTPVEGDVARLIGRLDHGPVGVVAGNPAAVVRLSKALSFHIANDLLTASLNEPDSVRHVVEHSDVIACTARCKSVLDQLGVAEKSVTIRYSISHASLEELLSRISGQYATASRRAVKDTI